MVFLELNYVYTLRNSLLLLCADLISFCRLNILLKYFNFQLANITLFCFMDNNKQLELWPKSQVAPAQLPRTLAVIISRPYLYYHNLPVGLPRLLIATLFTCSYWLPFNATELSQLNGSKQWQRSIQANTWLVST